MPITITNKMENQNNGNNKKRIKQLNTRLDLECNSWMVWNRPRSSVKVSREISRSYMKLGINRLETNVQWKNISSLDRAPRKYKNIVGTSSNGLYLGSINCRNLFTNDDWAMGNKEQRSPWQGQSNKAAEEESQGNNQCLRPTRITGTSLSKQFIPILSWGGRGDRTCNSSQTRGIHCNEN